MDNAKIFTVEIDEVDSTTLERLLYEYNAAASIISILAEDQAIDFELLQSELDEAEKRNLTYSMTKAAIAEKYKPEEVDLNRFDWSLDFYEKIMTFTEVVPVTATYNKQIISVDVNEDDSKKLEQALYLYSIGADLLKFLKEDRAINPEIIKQYTKIVFDRKIAYEKTKAEIAYKYKTPEVDLTRFDWTLDFNTKIITYKET